MPLMIDNFDLVVLSIVKGCKIVDSLKRLYESGDVTGEELALVVGKFITLPEYNYILGIE